MIYSAFPYIPDKSQITQKKKRRRKQSKIKKSDRPAIKNSCLDWKATFSSFLKLTPLTHGLTTVVIAIIINSAITKSKLNLLALSQQVTSPGSGFIASLSAVKVICSYGQLYWYGLQTFLEKHSGGNKLIVFIKT